MKLQNLLASTALIAAMVGGGAASTFASDYPDAGEAKAKAEIEFLKDDEGDNTPVDPEDNEPVEPVDPDDVNPAVGDLVLTYASNLDFGQRKKSGTQWFAKLDNVTKANNPETIVPFVSIKDARGAQRTGWSLKVTQDAEFTTNEGAVLKGATLTFLDGHFDKEASGQPNSLVGSTGTALGVGTATELATAGAEIGVGYWAIGFGEKDAKGTTTTGVRLDVPKTTAKDSATYNTTLTYTLTAEPTN